MTSVFTYYSNMINTINSYFISLCTNKQETPETTKHFDIESQKAVNVHLSTDNNYTFRPIANCGSNKSNIIEWKRQDEYSDYEVSYCSRHYIISCTDIEKILCADIINNVNIEDILKMYIDNNEDCDLTLSQLQMQKN